jgi:hypothetical protein
LKTAVVIALAVATAAGAALVAQQPPLSLPTEASTVVLSDVDRGAARSLLLTATGPCALVVAIDGGALQWLNAGTAPALVALPPRRSPGLRVDLRAREGDACAVSSLRVTAGSRPPIAAALFGFLAAVAAAALTRRQPARLTAALTLAVSALALLACTPLQALPLLPAAHAALRVGLPLLFAAASLALGAAASHRRAYATGVGLAVAVVFGLWVRVYFLPSTGSWDTEYWKAWTLRAADAGITRVYGDAGTTTLDNITAQMRGQEPLWQTTAFGRAFTVDYPPLAQALWRWSWALVSRLPLDYGEALSIAVKVPPVLGDVLAALLLLWAIPGAGRSRALAALYWALPVSWVPSAVMGYLDGIYAPLLALAVVCAGRRRGGWAGSCLALACCIKPTAVVAAPAIALALDRAGVRRALLCGTAVVAAVVVPFALAGTLAAAIVHCYRILFQGTLSGGFANPWWAIGHALNVAAGRSALAGPVRFAPNELLALAARPLGTLAFAGATLLVCVWQRRDRARDPRLPAAAVFFCYAMLAIGVHENHPHPIALLLLLTGLATRPLAAAWAGFSLSYVVNMLMLSGLGRLHGLRYAALEPSARAIAGARMALGVDLTLVLVPINLVLFATVLAALARDRRAYNPDTHEALSP